MQLRRCLVCICPQEWNPEVVPFYFHVQGQEKMEGLEVAGYETLDPPMLMFANDALLRGWG